MQLTSRHRSAGLALAIAVALCILHITIDSRPVLMGFRGGDLRSPRASALELLAKLEGSATDLEFRLRGPVLPHPDVLVLAINEKSVQRFGRWPWRRDVLARAIEQLHARGVRAAGLDMAFLDEDPNDPTALRRADLSQLESALGKGPLATPLEAVLATWRERVRQSADERLAQAFAAAPEVVQGVTPYAKVDAQDHLPQHAADVLALKPHLITELPGSVPGSRFPVPLSAHLGVRFYSAAAPRGALAGASPRWGHFNAPRDPDGVLRRIPLFAQLEDPPGLLPSLALQTAAVYLGARVEPEWDPELQRVVGARLVRDGAAPLHVPLELTEPTATVDFVGPAAEIPTVSLADVIEGRLAEGALKGKAVLVGVTLVGEFDQVATPYSSDEPGVYTQASMLSSILAGRFLTRPPAARLFELLFMVLSALALGLFLPRVRFAAKAFGALALVFSFLALNYALFLRGYRVALVLPTLNLLACAVAVIFLGYLTTDRERGQVRAAFARYVSASVMDEVLAHPEHLKLGGEKRELTVLFSDIRGFTSLSERMAPDALVRFINSYLTPMTDIVLEEGGTLDKYMGDAIMAFWGAPVPRPDHALAACRAAVRFLERLEELKMRWRAEGLPELQVGVGISTGPMVVGNMGSETRFDYTVMGDAVNLGSRLEGLNKELGTRILVSEGTWAHVRERVRARPMGQVQVKGKSGPVAVYELVGLS